MPAGAVGSVWAAGSWSVTAWEANTWAAVVGGPLSGDLTQTLGDLTLVSASVAVTGLLDQTLADVTLVSTDSSGAFASQGFLQAAFSTGIPVRTGQTAFALDDLLASIAGDVAVYGELIATLEALSNSAYQPVARPGDRYRSVVGATRYTTTIRSSETDTTLVGV